MHQIFRHKILVKLFFGFFVFTNLNYFASEIYAFDLLKKLQNFSSQKDNKLPSKIDEKYFNLNYEKPRLLARGNALTTYQLPPFSFLNDSSPFINERGDVLFKLLTFNQENKQAIWAKKHDESFGRIIYASEEDEMISDPHINGEGIVVLSQFLETQSTGLFSFDFDELDHEEILTRTHKSVTNLIDLTKHPLQFLTYPQILNNGVVYFRGTKMGNHRGIYRLFDEELTVVLEEGNSLLPKKFEKENGTLNFLYRFSVNQNEELTLKVKFGEEFQWEEYQADGMIGLKNHEELAYNPEKHLKFFVLDQDGSKDSPFQSFFNLAFQTTRGDTLFVGLDKEGRNGIYLARARGKFSEVVVEKLISEGSFGLSEIEYFVPKMDGNGNVFFRGKNSEGRRSIYRLSHSKLDIILSEGDELETDLGFAKIILHKLKPGFSGDFSLNDQGDIVVHTVLTLVQSEEEIGEGVFIILRKRP